MNNISHVSVRPGTLEVLGHITQLVEGVTASSSDVLSRFGPARDMNRYDPARFTVPGIFSLPENYNGQRQRSGAGHFVAETLKARYPNGQRRYPKLTVTTNSLATKVLIKPKCTRPLQLNCVRNGKPKAYGVEYLKGVGLYGADRRYNAGQNGQKETVYASREVIVAGGGTCLGASDCNDITD